MSNITFDSHSNVDIVEVMGSDSKIVRMARASYALDTEALTHERENGILRFLIREGHHTPVEHCVMTFKIETPIFVARELLRHRTLSASEKSLRYVVSDLKFYMPDLDRPCVQTGKAGAYSFETDPHKLLDAACSIKVVCEHAASEYNIMVRAGIAKEVARMVLPVNVYTNLYITMNLRNLLHFLTLRTSDQALYEIREVANKMASLTEAHFPETFRAWEENKEAF